VNDISFAGLAFEFHRPISIGFNVAVRVPILVEHIDLSGRVVRCEPKGEGWIIAMEYQGREDVFRMRMVQQICHIEAYRARLLALEGREISSELAVAEWIAAHASAFPCCGL